ncbi:hypothetical protein M011DRAFT_457470 [Sporormia fimetaria CBS 119925]|uniref:Uncharacterized protein n=1 Tax=Sporormia fimetaria CBS 119925 TaxID=1340428 RepID=A0A6A6VDV6_9PLEO|nr:hypothetical protein M011DRAFT_457470 [Sporormia fimetaria CBS 119925]
MRLPSFTLLLSTLLCTAAAIEHVELVPIPRQEWDPALQHIGKRQNAPAANTPVNITLQDHEQILWTSPNMWTRADSLIIDMAKFSLHLKSVNCTSNMSAQFWHKAAYLIAKKEWEWVNFNGLRSFVLIADHFKCGRDWSLDPWVVRNARFDDKTLTIRLDAAKKTWKEVTSRYTMDFGEVERGGNHKRQLDWDYSKAFTVPLNSNFPRTIMQRKWPNADFGVFCVDCGTSGGLRFAGHIEGSLFGGVDQLSMTVTPEAIQANLGFEVTFGGRYNFRGKDFARQEIEVIDIPLPYSWSIPGILFFGPKLKVIAGYELEEISGRATVSTGVSATIPDSSLAKAELFGNPGVEVNGWIPVFSAQPIEIEAEIVASGSLYAGLGVSVAVEILDDTSVNLDLNLKFPELHITAAGGYKTGGWCPNNANPFGVSLDVSLGAELELIGWNEIDGKRNNLFDVDIYENEHVYDFDPLCFAFGDAKPGSCSLRPDVEYEDDMLDRMTKRSGYIGGPSARARNVVERQEMGIMGRPRKYALDCAPAGRTDWDVIIQSYPSPAEIIRDRDQAGRPAPSGVPALFPLIACSATDDDDCGPEKWKVLEIRKVDSKSLEDGDNEDKDGDGIIQDFESRLKIGNKWETEHVYEGNWIKEFFNYLHRNYYQSRGSADRCEYLAETIAKIGQSNAAFSLERKMVANIGNRDTYQETMVLLQSVENNAKYRFFDGTNNEIDAKFAAREYNGDTGVCALGHLVNVCNYMSHPTTQRVMKRTLERLNAVLTEYDSIRDPNDGGPASYKEAHEAWLTEYYQEGIEKGREKINTYAELLEGLDDYDDVDETLRNRIASDLKTVEGISRICVNNLVFP